jgi:hypothetical protein
LLAVTRAAVSRVTTAYTDHRKTSSSERNNGRKAKLSDRNRCTLKRTVSKNDTTAAAKVTTELDSHPEDTVSTEEKSDQSFTNPTSMAQLQLLDF